MNREFKLFFFLCSDVEAVASLGLVSPGAATDGVTLFSWKKNWRPF